MKDNTSPLLRLRIAQEPDVVSARQKTRQLSELLGFDSQDQARIATAVSELARNIFQYVGSGTIEFSFALEGSPQGLVIEAIDAGPGIANLDSILNGTYVSKTGMGLGLIGSKRLMDEFAIQSAPGQGTRIKLVKHLGRRQAQLSKKNLTEVIDKLITKAPETPFEEVQRQNRDLLNALEELQVRKTELSDLNRELSETNRGVVALYAELDEKASSLQKANEIKTSFLSNMTHEFRTPLSSIISLTRILLDRLDGPLTSEQEIQVSLIQKSSEGLLELVNDLLDLAKVEAGKVALNVSEFDIEEILGGLRGMFRPLLGQDSAVELRVLSSPGIPLLSSDQGKVTQILRNLIANAIKYTEKGTVTVRARHDSKNDLVEISVTDTGIGIRPEHLASVFDDFSQVESSLQRKAKGTGLGLPLSRKLARLLNGDVAVQSAIGAGSTFTARIPRVYRGPGEAVLIQPQTEQALALEESTFAANEAFKILLVDDDEASRYVLKSLIRGQINAEFIEASDGAEGLMRMKESRPDAVFLDLSMPRMDGIEVLEIVQNDPLLKQIPVIVNTAKKMSAKESLFLSSTAKAVISKERQQPELATQEIRRALHAAGFDYVSEGMEENVEA